MVEVVGVGFGWVWLLGDTRPDPAGGRVWVGGTRPGEELVSLIGHELSCSPSPRAAFRSTPVYPSSRLLLLRG